MTDILTKNDILPSIPKEEKITKFQKMKNVGSTNSTGDPQIILIIWELLWCQPRIVDVTTCGSNRGYLDNWFFFFLFSVEFLRIDISLLFVRLIMVGFCQILYVVALHKTHTLVVIGTILQPKVSRKDVTHFGWIGVILSTQH